MWMLSIFSLHLSGTTITLPINYFGLPHRLWTPTTTQCISSIGRKSKTALPQYMVLFFRKKEKKLNHSETILTKKHTQWFSMLEYTALTKSYKMVSLAVLIGAQAIHSGMELEQFCFQLAIISCVLLLRYDIPSSIQNIEQWKRYFLRWIASSWNQGKNGWSSKREHTYPYFRTSGPHNRFCRDVAGNHSLSSTTVSDTYSSATFVL